MALGDRENAEWLTSLESCGFITRYSHLCCQSLAQFRSLLYPLSFRGGETGESKPSHPCLAFWKASRILYTQPVSLALLLLEVLKSEE